jgi:lipocalin
VTSGSIYQIDFGSSAALSKDGNTAVVGAPNGSTGSTWVFARNGNAWSLQGSALVGNGATGNYATLQGASVALSPDASTAIVGGPDDDNLIGAAWVFVQD